LWLKTGAFVSKAGNLLPLLCRLQMSDITIKRRAIGGGSKTAIKQAFP
jgi:hypothetical protein